MSSLINISACQGTWPRLADLGLPCPVKESFSYTVDIGAVRTQLDVGRARARKVYSFKPRSYELTWYIQDHSELDDLVAFLESDTAREGWVYVPLITDQVGMWRPADHLIRFVGDVQIELVQKELWQVKIAAEQYTDTTACTIAAGCDDFKACLYKMNVAAPQLNYPALDAGWPP